MVSMRDLRQVEESLAANGRVEGNDLEVLRRVMYDDGKIDRQKADILAELHKRVQRRTPGFERFFYQAIRDFMLADGRVTAEKAAWLRQLLLSGGRISDEGRQLLHRLKGEAKEVSPEFKTLFAEAMKEPPEQHTSGG